jgi:hypothetical protein
MTDEIWRAIPGYDGLYEVSDAGRVRSLDRPVRHRLGGVFTRRGRLLRPCVTSAGYHQVTLTVGGFWVTRVVHKLVVAAFIGPRAPGMVTRHLDGDKTNNRTSNLAYGTSQENSDDMQRHGTVPKGVAHSMAKLTEDDVLRIRSSAASGVALAEQFGVSNQLISRIRTRGIWKHLP